MTPSASWSLRQGRAVAGVVLVTFMVVALWPAPAPAYVENEYVQKMSAERIEEAIAREKEREAVAAASAQRKVEEEQAVIAAQARRVQEEREGRAQTEQAERAQREATEREDRAREAREARASECVVSRVVGDSLRVATIRLRKAHCAVGHVSRSRSSRGKLVVLKVGRRVGVRLPEGTAIAIKLGHQG